MLLHLTTNLDLIIIAPIARTSDLKVDFWPLFRLMVKSEDTFELSFVAAIEVSPSLHPNDKKLNRPVQADLQHIEVTMAVGALEPLI
jgi:hypothetical protein